MAGGNHNSRGGMLIDNRKADRRGGGVGPGQPAPDTIGGHHAGHFGRIAIRQKAGVKADYNAGIGRILFQYVIGNCLGHQPQISKSEGITDNGSPAIRTEFDSQNRPPF